MHHVFRDCLLLLGLFSFSSAAPCAGATLVVLDFELIDDLNDPGSIQTDQRRLLQASSLLRERLGSCAGIDIANTQSARTEIAQVRARNRYAHRCNGCAQAIARSAQAHFVLFPWVQKVSNLILNINAEVRAAEDGSLIAARSVDIRGNTDRSWSRGVAALAQRLCEKDAAALSRERER